MERTDDVPPSGEPWPASGATPGRDLPKVLDGQQALLEGDWLLEGVFPEMDELHAEHRKVLDEALAARDEAGKLRQGFGEEDEAREAALAEGKEPPPRTGSADRQDALEDARARMWAAWDRVAVFVTRAQEVIKEKAGERPEFPDEPGVRLSPWRQELASERAAAAEEVEKARRAMLKAERDAANVDQVELWLDRLVKPRGGRYMPAPQLGVGFPTAAERERRRLGQQDVEAMMAEVG